MRGQLYKDDRVIIQLRKIKIKIRMSYEVEISNSFFEKLRKSAATVF